MDMQQQWEDGRAERERSNRELNRYANGDRPEVGWRGWVGLAVFIFGVPLAMTAGAAIAGGIGMIVAMVLSVAVLFVIWGTG